MLSEKVRKVMGRLCGAGCEAYAVGGCVRDIYMGKAPSDFDIATSALPEQTEAVFTDCQVIKTGIAHGTVTVLWEGEPFEITTFRCDGEYRDHRRPESVAFTGDISADLARRDFTINSMAQDLYGCLIDPYGGREDIKNGIIRCTGDARRRFDEDALRIMRALRFASVLDFKIEEETALAIHEKKALLGEISVERIFSELKKLLCGRGVFRVLTEFSDVLCTVIPEMVPAVGFEHKSRYHVYDVYKHILKTVEAVKPESVLRLTMLLHDIGKPYCFTEEGEVRHFKGHPEKSAEIAEKVLRRLRADNETAERVVLLCKYHDVPIEPREKCVRRLFFKMPYDAIIELCHVRVADSAAHNPAYGNRGAEAEIIMKLAEKIEAEKQCVSLKSLSVNGNDIKALGFSGAQIGAVLNALLSAVVDEKLENDRDILLAAAEKMKDTLIF